LLLDLAMRALQGMRALGWGLRRVSAVKPYQVKRAAHQHGVLARWQDYASANDINLEVAQGEFLCIVGPSGCGKSKLLSAMAGFLSPTGDGISIDGQVVTGPDPRRIFVFQERGVLPWRTVEANIGFGLSLRTGS
jgi:ABC-type nitrate/sulfonate/bicarbonate transport system ATPase subunit